MLERSDAVILWQETCSSESGPSQDGPQLKQLDPLDQSEAASPCRKFVVFIHVRVSRGPIRMIFGSTGPFFLRLRSACCYVPMFTISHSVSSAASSCGPAIYPRCNSQMTNGSLKSSLRGLLPVSVWVCVWIYETSAHRCRFIIRGTTWGKHLLLEVSSRKQIMMIHS